MLTNNEDNDVKTQLKIKKKAEGGYTGRIGSEYTLTLQMESPFGDLASNYPLWYEYLLITKTDKYR